MSKRIAFQTMLMYADSGYEDHYKYPPSCEYLGYEKNTDNGFYAKAFYDKPTGQIVISISGTNPANIKHLPSTFGGAIKDISNDLNMAVGNIPPQIESAIKFYNRITETHKGVDIIFTGHSLGGSDSQIMSKLTGCDAVTFNAFSTGNDDGKEYDNIINIINSEDYISMADINTHPGKIYITPNTSGNYLMPRLGLPSEPHKLENLRLWDITEYERGSIKSYFDKIRTGESLKYEAEGVGLNTIKRIYDLWDLSKKLRGWYLDKQTKLKESLKTGATYINGQGLINRGDTYVKNPSEDSNKNYVDYGNNTFHLYAQKTGPGHWVTVNGNHVYMEK